MSELERELFELCKRHKLHALVAVPLWGAEAQVITVHARGVTADWALRNAAGAVNGRLRERGSEAIDA